MIHVGGKIGAFGRSMSTGSIKETLPAESTLEECIEEGDVDSGHTHSRGDTPGSKPTGLKGLLVSGTKNFSLRRRNSGTLRTISNGKSSNCACLFSLRACLKIWILGQSIKCATTSMFSIIICYRISNQR